MLTWGMGGWGGKGGGREKGAFTVYVKVLHCLMLNTSFCTSCLRGVYMGGVGEGGFWGIGLG